MSVAASIPPITVAPMTRRTTARRLLRSSLPHVRASHPVAFVSAAVLTRDVDMAADLSRGIPSESTPHSHFSDST